MSNAYKAFMKNRAWQSMSTKNAIKKIEEVIRIRGALAHERPTPPDLPYTANDANNYKNHIWQLAIKTTYVFETLDVK